MKKTIIITGASSGVGASLVKLFSKEMTVIALARRIDRLSSLYGKNKNVKCLKIDLTNLEELNSTIDEILSLHPRIEYLINCAGVIKPGKLLGIKKLDTEESLLVNFQAPLILMQKVIPHMLKYNFGRIINVTSGAPLNNFPGYSLYSASKAALNSLTVTAAKELINTNVKINLMSPGAVKSEMAPNASNSPDICHPTAEYLINLDEDGPSGEFFWLGYKVPLSCDLSDANWLEGKPSKSMINILN